MPSSLVQESRPTNSPWGKLLWDSHYKSWRHSPRKKGSRALDLRGNPLEDYRGQYVIFNDKGGLLPHVGPYTSRPARAAKLEQRLQAESYARFRGKLYKGSAALGVTLAGWKQSREMIVKRYQQLTAKAEKTSAALIGGNKKGSELASVHLEIVFGWMPLLEDIHNATFLITSTETDKIFVSASARGFDHWKEGSEQWTVNGRVNRASGVSIHNPNLWLQERAGLLNPAAVAWDLVPWSFVVNMFVNTGQLVNSLTDFAGLSFDSPTMTTTHEWSAERLVKSSGYTGHSLQKGRQKVRVADGLARPPLLFRLPEVDLGLAAIAASLFTQKMAPVYRLMTSRSRLRYTE